MPQVIDKPRARAAQETYSLLTEVLHCPSCDAPMIKVPVLRCAECAALTPLRAFTYKTKRGYIAECIDLNLVSQGRTEEEAIGSLQEAMFGYLDTVFDGNSTKGLVLRKSPLRNRIRYHLHTIIPKITRYLGGRNRGHFLPSQPGDNKAKLCHC
jgi:predicted RNase H-like HicB family nuclease